jgi:hypothetical protein
VEALLATLLWITLATSAVGLVTTLVVATRCDGRASALLLLFGGVLVHQSLVAVDPPTASLTLSAAGLQAVSLLAIALGGLVGLFGLARIGRERNGAEELHWDAMEMLRAVNEISLPGGSEEPLAELLTIGARRFELEIAAVLLRGAREPVALRMPGGPEVDRPRVASALRRYAEWKSDRPFIDDTPGPTPPLPLTRVFIATLYRDGEAFGNLAFASTAPNTRKLTATDKDLLALLANSATRLLSPESRETPDAARSEPSLVDRLRERLAGNAVELALDPSFEDAPDAEIPLEDIAYGLACGARLVSSTGGLRVESGSIRSPEGESQFITLTVHIDDPALDASALNGVSTTGSTSLEALGEQLKNHGGDVSMSVETGVGASMTAFVPIASATGDDTSSSDPRPRYLS